jgi:LacI family transcriptional regulator
MSKRITMADVAREAGVSLMTVSRAVNNKDGISDATRQRIQSIAERLGYRPSLVARGLVTDRTSTIGLVVIDNANPFFSEVARGVEHAAYAEGYNVFLCNTEEDPQRELDVLRSLEEQRVDGVILCSSRLNDERLRAALKSHPAKVLINRSLIDDDFGVVLAADEQGAQLIIQHLLGTGHHAIGFLAGPKTSFSGQQRLRGYRSTLAEAGITPPAGWQRHCLPIVESGREVAHDLLNDHSELTALFCYNDLTAVGALQACRQLGRRVPDDIAIVGFDDVLLAALVTPALTTCRVPMYDMGREALRQLIERINGCAHDCTPVEFQPELIIRESAPGA